MIRCLIVLSLLCTWNCSSSAGPPAGPTHVPSDSHEAETACPAERLEAQSAREMLLGQDVSGESGVALRRSAAEKVLAHGECEAAAADAMPKADGDHDQILTNLRAHREQVHTATHLLREVSRYDEEGYGARASIAEAKLKLAFASTVAAVQPPADLDVRGRLAFESETSSAAQVLRLEAATLLETLLGGMAESDPLQAEACRLLTQSGQATSGSCP